MAGKTSVSTLHEYCAKRKLPTPDYSEINFFQGSFACRVNVKDIEAEGIGRSKRDAKHAAAANAIKMLQKECEISDELLNVDLIDEELNGLATMDMIVTLRDYCVLHRYPLPEIEIEAKGGMSHAPVFVARCKVASIQRTATSNKKKDAKQKAVAAVYHVLQQLNCNNTSKELCKNSTGSNINDKEFERYQKFKTYRELTNNTSTQKPEILLCERHNYFRNFYDSLKQEAKAVLNAKYEDEQQQVMDLFKALKITPTINRTVSEKNPECNLISISMDCEFGAYFIDLENTIYSTILDYFRDMLD